MYGFVFFSYMYWGIVYYKVLLCVWVREFVVKMKYEGRWEEEEGRLKDNF